MKEESRQAFFEYVKGKKIRWSCWEESRWFIPEDLKNRDELFGSGNLSDVDAHYVSNGFEMNNISGNYWEFYKKLSYKYYQDRWLKDNNLEVGSWVEVTKTVESRKNGWMNSWNENMDDSLNNKFKIRKIDGGSGITLESKGFYSFSYESLEPCEPPKTRYYELQCHFNFCEKGTIFKTLTDKKYVGNGMCLDNEIVENNPNLFKKIN